jgi:Raf kinase inhibitor-like YbhB/YbcL family protein
MPELRGALTIGIAVVAIAACSQPQQQEKAVSQMSLTSKAFADGQPIPPIYSCDGRNISPPLAWSGVPNGTKSLVIAIDDPDAPGGTFRHWAAYDIPPNLHDLPAAAGKPGNPAFKQSLNDGGNPGYTGMCPPKGKGLHHYHFRLFAIDVAHLDVADGAKVEEVEHAAEQHQLATAELVGTFERE